MRQRLRSASFPPWENFAHVFRLIFPFYGSQCCEQRAQCIYNDGVGCPYSKGGAFSRTRVVGSVVPARLSWSPREGAPSKRVWTIELHVRRRDSRSDAKLKS